MAGDREGEHMGVIPRTVKFIFECIEELVAMGWEFDVMASYLEIYNETIRDLLRSSGKSGNNDDHLLEDLKCVRSACTCTVLHSCLTGLCTTHNPRCLP